MDKQIKEIVDRCKEKIDHIILSQPERITPLQQCEAVSNQIDSLVEDMKHHLTNKSNGQSKKCPYCGTWIGLHLLGCPLHDLAVD